MEKKEKEEKKYMARYIYAAYQNKTTHQGIYNWHLVAIDWERK